MRCASRFFSSFIIGTLKYFRVCVSSRVVPPTMARGERAVRAILGEEAIVRSLNQEEINRLPASCTRAS